MEVRSVGFAFGRPGFGDVEGGAIIQVKKTMSALSKNGVSTKFIESPTDLSSSPDIDILHIYNMPFSRRTLRFVEAGKRRGLDVVVTPVYWDFSHSQIVEFFTQKFGIEPSPAMKHAVPLLCPLYRFGRRILRSEVNFNLHPNRFHEILDRADLILPNSEMEMVQLAEMANFDLTALREKSRIVYNAADTELFEPVEDASTIVKEDYGISDYVLQVGAIYPNKNQGSVLKAVDNLNVPLVLIGRADNKYGKDIVRTAADKDGVLVIDELPHEELPKFYSAAQTHVLPSFRDSPGLVSLEAAMCGAEVVVSNSTHCPVDEYFHDNAHVCDPYSTTSIRKTIVDAYSEPHNDKEFRDRLRTRFSWDKTAADTIKAYRTLS